jgi:myo-inositol 2-dehydrogenase/D-chiro-inositol 1-dehydrogenase
MGKRHALNFLNPTPRAELVTKSTPDEAEIQWAKTYLEPFGVHLYKDYEEMEKQAGLQAVVIASISMRLDGELRWLNFRI